MPSIEGRVTITPGFNEDTLVPGSRYRWTVNIPLPFFFPVKNSVHQNPEILGDPYDLWIYNDYDRFFVGRKLQPGLPLIYLAPKGTQIPVPEDSWQCVEHLKAVASFVNLNEFSTPSEAFANAEKKIEACFEVLCDLILNWQKSAPYHLGWLMHPVSLNEVKTLVHSVERLNTDFNRWQVFSSTVQLSTPKNSIVPLAAVDLPEKEIIAPNDLANELLADASVSLYRSSYRSVVVLSFSAIDCLVQTVRKLMKTKSDAAPKTETKRTKRKDKKRSSHGLSEKILHKTLKEECGHSLLDEKPTLHESLKDFEELRHKVTHKGYKPSQTETLNGYKTACEVVNWLSSIAGLPTKPFNLEHDESSLIGFDLKIDDCPPLENIHIRVRAGRNQTK